MSQDIFLFFMPTAQARLLTEVWKTKNGLRSSFLLFGLCKGPRGKRKGKALSGADLGLRSSQFLSLHSMCNTIQP